MYSIKDTLGPTKSILILQGILILQVRLYAKGFFGTNIKCPDYTGVLVVKCPD